MAEQTARNWSSGDIVTAANLSSIERGVSALTEEYTPTTWANGDTVTAAGLNNIEHGIANAGGGNSDFSTAKVTFNTTDNKGYIVNVASLDNINGVIPAFIEVVGSKTVSLPLYKGVYTLVTEAFDFIDSSQMPETSGDITFIHTDDFTGFTITGNGAITRNGTITISDSPNNDTIK